MAVKFNKNRIILIFLIVFSIVAFISLLNFLFLDKTPPHWDYALHLRNTLIYYENLKNLNLIKFLSIYTYYPPLTYILLSLLVSIIGYSKFTILIFNLSFLSLMFYVAYRFTKTLFDKFTSLTLISFLIFLVVTLSPSRVLIWELMTDFPLMVLIFNLYCSFYLSFKKNNFGRKKSLSLGLLIALAFLVK
jgi:4-amino-4-deoxy-L-arabinose transferase-like glycosyltransferase